MKNFQNIVLILFFLLISILEGNCIAQQLFDENSLLIQEYFQTINKNSLVSQNIKVLPKAGYNTIALSLNQKGDNNNIEIKAGKVTQVVSQVGSHNQYNFINYYNSNSSNLTILQQGFSNSLQIYGQNSIIESISIIQKSNFKSLIIKNY